MTQWVRLPLYNGGIVYQSIVAGQTNWCFWLAGFSIECYECIPGFDDNKGGINFCDSPTNKTTCSSIHDSCLTASYKVKTEIGEIGGSVMACGLSGYCEAQGKAGCDNAKKSGPVSYCNYECCKEDLCNNKSLLKKPESAGRRDVAHFGAIFAAVMRMELKGNISICCFLICCTSDFAITELFQLGTINKNHK